MKFGEARDTKMYVEIYSGAISQSLTNNKLKFKKIYVIFLPQIDRTFFNHSKSTLIKDLNFI